MISLIRTSIFRFNISELGKVVNKRRNEDSIETLVLNTLPKICVEEKLSTYSYIPPQMIKACKYFTSKSHLGEREREREREREKGII